MPSLTPAQRQFGIGLLPANEMFRPPPGMEFDPAYSPMARQQQALAANADMQRQAYTTQQREFTRAQQTADAEDAAIEGLRGAAPGDIPNVLAQFPELARSKNLSGVLHYAQVVNPSAGQKTLAPSLRMKLKPEERAYFDQHFNQSGSAMEAFDMAQQRSGHDQFLADAVANGATLQDIQALKDRHDLAPYEREAFKQQFKGRTKGHPMQEAFEMDLKGLYDDPEFLALPPAEKAKRVKGMRIDYELDPSPVVAPVTPVAAPAAVVTPPPAIQNVDLSKVPYAQREQYVADIEKKAKEDEERSKAWYDAQIGLQSKLEKELPGNIGNTNYSKLRSFAEAIVNEDFEPEGGAPSMASELGAPYSTSAMVPVGMSILNKLGLKGTAFKEPKTGQLVPYKNLLKTWAENYLKEAPITAQPQLAPISQETAKVKTNLLNKVGLKPNG